MRTTKKKRTKRKNSATPLRRIMDARGISTAEMHVRTKAINQPVSPTTINAAYYGYTERPTRDTLQPLAQVLGVPWETLRTEAGDGR